jgi:hypothetical protein
MTTRLVDAPSGAMGNTVIRYDDNGKPMYASDLRLGNRKIRRRLLRAERAAMAERST